MPKRYFNLLTIVFCLSMGGYQPLAIALGQAANSSATSMGQGHDSQNEKTHEP